MTDRTQISRGMFLKGANCPGVLMTKGLSPEERKADVERRIVAALKERNEAMQRQINETRLTLAVRRWRVGVGR